MTRHLSPTGTPLFRTQRGSVSNQSRVSTPSQPSVQHAPVGELSLSGVVKTLDRKFEIRSTYDPAATGFFHSLPDSRWSGKTQVWKCLATPLAAHMLRGAGLVMDAESAAMAELWDRAIAKPVQGSVDTSLLLKPPRDAQIRSMEFCANKAGSILEHEMGLGKSYCGVGLIIHWRCRMVLTLCPKAVLGVWRREMAQYCGLSHNVTVLDGSGTEKNRLFAEAIRQAGSFAINMVVCNYESAWREPLYKALLGVQWDALICDEAHRIGQPNNRSSKAAHEFAIRSKHRLLLTGTPFETPLDFFGQAKLIEPALFGTSFTRFRSRYAICHEQFKSKVLKLQNMDEFNSKHKLVALRYETKDVWDLPPLTHTVIPVELEAKTMQSYKTMRKQCLLELESGEVTAANAAVKLIKLAQLTGGHIKDDTGKVTRIGDEKRKALIDFLTDLPKHEKIVVFCRFTEDLRIVQEVAHEIGRTYGEISGQQKDLTEHAKFPDHISIMGVQERAGGLGVDLTAARLVVWYSHGYSSRDHDQAVARCHRPGQTRPTFIYHLVANGTVDGAIMSAIENKKEIVTEVLSHVKASKNL